MKKLYLIKFFLVTSIIFAQNKQLKIYPNFNDCINCNTGLNYVKSISQNIEVNIYVSDKEKDYLQVLLDSYELSRKYNIVYLKNYNNSLKSQCAYYNNGLKNDSFPLIDLHKKDYLFIKNISNNLNDTLIISNRCNFQTNINALISTDYLLNRVTYSLLNQKKESLIIEGKQFKPKLFFELGKIDSVMYWKNYKVLKYLNKHYPHIDLSFASDSCLYLLLSFPYPMIDQKNELHIKTKVFIYIRNLNTNSRKLCYLLNTELYTKTNQKVYLDNLMPFFVKDNKIFIGGYMDNDLSKKYWYYENEFDKDTLKFNGHLVNLPLDSITQAKFKKQIEETIHLVNNKFVFISGFPLIFNFTNNTHYVIKNFELSTNHTFINDVAEDNANLYLITLKDNNASLNIVKKENCNLIKTKNISLTENDMPSSIKFIGDKIFILNNNKFNYRLISR